MSLSNFLRDLKALIGDEEVEAVTYITPRGHDHYEVGTEEFDWWGEGEDVARIVEVVGPVAWEEAKENFNYTYDTGFGGIECNAIHLWTPTKVIIVVEYDGSSDVIAVPRHPTPDAPRFY